MNRKLLIPCSLGLLLLAWSCQNNEPQDNTTPMNVNPTSEKVQDVAGRRNFGAHAVITPLPAIMIATYDAAGTPDVMMAAWGGQCGRNLICFNLGPRKTRDNIRLRRAFTVSFASEDDVVQSDYFGIVSANDVPDKVARAGFTVIPSPNVDAPIVNEYPLTLECRVVRIDDWDGDRTQVVGEIVNMSADERILTNGKVDLAKLRPIIYDSASRAYRAVGDSVGTAWLSGKVLQQ